MLPCLSRQGEEGGGLTRGASEENPGAHGRQVTDGGPKVGTFEVEEGGIQERIFCGLADCQWSRGPPHITIPRQSKCARCTLT